MFSLPSQDRSSPPTTSKPSGRKGNKKVRTGCITCKVRKVKCDEAKPHCLRCIKTGRKCDGYRSPSPRTSPPPLPLSPSPGFESSQESRAFDYYRTRSAKVLSGAIDANFWGGLVLKLSANEPAIRHAVLALSSLHECVDVKCMTGKDLDRSLAFREYGNAIRSLRNWAQRDETSAIPLIVCVLFICIEFLADRDTASQMHINQGRRILSGLSNSHSPAMEVIRHSLVPIYARLSLASFLFGNRAEPIPDHLKAWTEMPVIFTSVEEARSGLYYILDQGLQFSVQAYETAYDPAPDPALVQRLQTEQQRLLSQLSRWHSAFTVLTSMSIQSSASEQVLNILRLYHQVGIIWTMTANQTNELGFDAHLSTFASVISLASTIINSLPNNARMESFSFETELIAPIYWTAVKCRHPLLRRAALKLLTRDQMRNRRENLWHVRETTVIAARVIEIEEAELSSPPPTIPGGSPLDSIYSDDMIFDYDHLPGHEALPPKIPTTRPPSLPAPKPSFEDPTPDDILGGNGFTPEPSPDDGVDEPQSPTTMAVDAMQQLDLTTMEPGSLDPPFSIPESRRVKNAVIGPAEEGGVWATFFKAPRLGESEWDIKREFLRC